MAHLTLKLETKTVEVPAAEAAEALGYGFDADNVLKWVFCAVIGQRKARGQSTGRRAERAMQEEAQRILREGCPTVLDCRVSAW